MTMESFEAAFDSIKRKWDHHFTADLRLQIYHIVKNAPDDSFRGLTKRLLWKGPYQPPDIGEFIEFSREFSKKAVIKTNFCKFCGYSGAVTCLDGEGIAWVYRCSCEHSKELPTEIILDGKIRKPFKTWESVKHLYKIVPPVNRTLKVFTDEENKQNFQLLKDVLYKRITKEEMLVRVALLERAIEIAQEREGL